jgi:hypothetical protein
MLIHTELESEIQELSDKIQTLLSGVPLDETFGTKYSKQDLLTSIGKIRNLADELTTRNAELSAALKLARDYVKNNYPPATFKMI